ncbi:MAG: transposase [Hyphomicrobiaceae bacterium]
MKKQNYVGIDVSAKTFTVIIDHNGDRGEAFDLTNDADGHKKLVRLITKKGYEARVVLEATGV